LLRWEADVQALRCVGIDTKKADEIQRRLIQLGARTTRVAKMLPRSDEGRYISQQLLRSGLAAAPNYAEARAAESRTDFIHKLRVVLKELNETHTWLEQIVANGLFSRDKMAAIIAENQELRWIIAASLKTAPGTTRSV
jgi:four helix bundle protein